MFSIISLGDIILDWENESDFIEKMQNLEKYRNMLPSWCPPFFASWVPKMLNQDPLLRPSLKDLVDELCMSTTKTPDLTLHTDNGQTLYNYVYRLEDFPNEILHLERSEDLNRHR